MNRAKFFASVRSTLFNGSMNEGQVDGIDAILDGAGRTPVDPRFLAYMLATAYHETARTMQPVPETRQPSEAANPSVDIAIGRLDRSWAAGRMPWVKQAYWRKDADGKSWLGRGLVQLTFKANYEKLGRMIGVDLVANPDLAMTMSVAVDIMFKGMIAGAFTGKKLADYFNSKSSDWKGARRIINPDDMGPAIAGYAEHFYDALQDAA